MIADDPLATAVRDTIAALLADRDRLRRERDQALAELASIRRPPWWRRLSKTLNRPMEV